MRKLIAFLMTALMIVSLAACGKKAADSSGAASSDPGPVDGSYAAVSIENETNDYEKKLVPLDLIPGETTDGSLYYRSVVKDDEVCYEIQPEGEEEPMTIPVSSAVIYVVENPEDCKVAKVSFDYVVDGESEHVEQYRIFSLPDAGIRVNGDGAGSETAADGATSADISAAVESDASGPAGEADIPGPDAGTPDASADTAGSSAAD